MNVDKIRALHEEWKRNEEELLRLRDLPVGVVDPAAREREIEHRQREIEFWVAELDSECQ
ncbi:MAG: hypothetical protein IT432_12145 [Phycisphaerales bacterium]|nr:hypothetical protein [Phycisphaerales bacterium]